MQSASGTSCTAGWLLVFKGVVHSAQPAQKSFDCLLIFFFFFSFRRSHLGCKDHLVTVTFKCSFHVALSGAPQISWYEILNFCTFKRWLGKYGSFFLSKNDGCNQLEIMSVTVDSIHRNIHNAKKVGSTLAVVPPTDQHFQLSSEISQHLPHGSAQTLVKTFMVPRQCVLMPLLIPWISP